MRVLFVDDDARLTSSVLHLLRALGQEARASVYLADAKLAVANFHPHVAIVDIGLADGESGLELTEWLRATHPEVRRVLITGDTTAVPHASAHLLLKKPLGLLEMQRALGLD
jgi:ActR/RegA family two-component response regulator